MGEIEWKGKEREGRKERGGRIHSFSSSSNVIMRENGSWSRQNRVLYILCNICILWKLLKMKNVPTFCVFFFSKWPQGFVSNSRFSHACRIKISLVSYTIVLIFPLGQKWHFHRHLVFPHNEENKKIRKRKTLFGAPMAISSFFSLNRQRSLVIFLPSIHYS